MVILNYLIQANSRGILHYTFMTNTEAGNITVPRLASSLWTIKTPIITNNTKSINWRQIKQKYNPATMRKRVLTTVLLTYSEAICRILV
jgi:hypothetical protein